MTSATPEPPEDLVGQLAELQRRLDELTAQVAAEQPPPPGVTEGGGAEPAGSLSPETVRARIAEAAKVRREPERKPVGRPGS